MNIIWMIIKKNMEIISTLDPEEYPELCRLKEKTTVMTHLYAIMQHMQTYSTPIWPAVNPSYFLFSIRYLERWGKENGYKGGKDTWQSHKVFLLHAGLIKTHPVIGEQTDPMLQRIWETAVKNNQRSETLWTVPLYVPAVLERAEQIAREYRENHINLTKITKDAIAAVWGQPTANALYRVSDHIISSHKHLVRMYLIQAMNEMIDKRGYTTEAEMRSECLLMCTVSIDIGEVECLELIEKIMAQKRSLINKEGCEYHRIRKEDKLLGIPNEYKQYIITRIPSKTSEKNETKE